MTLSTIQNELRELATQQGLSLPGPPPRDRGASRPAAKLPSALSAAAREAVAGYRASDDYRDLIASRDTLDLAGLQARAPRRCKGRISPA